MPLCSFFLLKLDIFYSKVRDSKRFKDYITYKPEGQRPKWPITAYNAQVHRGTHRDTCIFT